MSYGFWKNLKKPIFVLAPMADVTDPAFRYIIAKYGKPDVTWTEFVSADGLALAPEEGRKKLMRDLEYGESERPIVAQFFTARPENMKKAAVLAKELGFDGIDINMGCPDKKVEKQGSGAALMRNSDLARELIRTAKEGAGNLPVTIKIRVGYNTPVLDTWLPEVLKEEPAVVTIHARTRKEMSKVPANWDYVKQAVEIRNRLNSKTLIFGNGDASDLEDAKKRVEEAGCDGAMLGRAIFGNPWLFSDRKNISVEEKLKVLVEHTKKYEDLLGDIKSFALMKKHYKAYVNGFDGAVELRTSLMEAENANEVAKKVSVFLGNN